jgi:hypothetical protein
MEVYKKGAWEKELKNCTMRWKSRKKGYGEMNYRELYEGMEEYEKGVWGKELENGMRMEDMTGWKCTDARHCTYARDVERTQKEQ